MTIIRFLKTIFLIEFVVGFGCIKEMFKQKKQLIILLKKVH